MLRLWTPALALLIGCDRIFSHPQVEEPCGVSVTTTAHRTEQGAQVRLSTTCIEDAWNLGSFPTARLDGLAVMTNDGAPLQTGALAYSPDPEGGVFRIPVSPVTADARYIRLTGRFVGVDAAGQDVVGERFDGQVLIEEAPAVP